MNSDDVQRRAGKPEFISGIHNYCDQWCERCMMTDRCAIYDPARDRRRNPDAAAADPEDFWRELSETLLETVRMIHDMAAQQGIDFNAAEFEEYEREEEQHKEDADAHPLAVTSLEYAELVDQWFEDHKPLLEEMERELQAAQAAALPGRQPAQEAAAIGDCIDVILWHQRQIHVKLMRALLFEPSMVYEPDEPTDTDGSTKVALIGADRSLAAWGIMRDYLPDASDGILDLLVCLDRIRRLAEQTFPRARAFIRPGFDTES